VANYSGRAVKAPPPTYPPEQVASAILGSALHPTRERIVGGAGRLVTVAEAVAPRQFEGVNRRHVKGRQFAAEPAPATDGNPYAPVSDRRAAARGGWRRRPDPADVAEVGGGSRLWNRSAAALTGPVRRARPWPGCARLP
jgi:hypothetical protein